MENDFATPGGPQMIRWLWTFHAWTRPRIMAAASRLDASALRRPGVIPGGQGDGSLYETLAHLVGTEFLWLARWNGAGRAELPSGADYANLDQLGHVWEETELRRARPLGELDELGLQREIAYLSVTRGVMEAFPLWQTLIHASNHTTHHRAEACVALTALGSPPESIDLIDFMRAATPFDSRP